MAIYHLNVKTGSRIGGQSALAKADYIEREGKYAKDAEDLAYRESGNMPGWAEDDPRQYWAAADEHERANGRLFVQVEFALPRELDDRQQREVASSFAADLTGGERLPYTLAIHRGGVNPHAHLMISERGLDGHDRDAATWFKRANTKDPEKGGAKKTSTLSSREWLEETRERWADRANEALERAGRPERINEASLENQYWEAAENGDEREMARLQGREPGVHIGPHNIRRFLRGEQSDRLEEAMDAQDRNRIRVVETELTRVEQQIRELKEIYDRARAAIDKRLEQVGRAMRAGADAVGRAGAGLVRSSKELVRSGEKLGRSGEELGRAASLRPERVYRVQQSHDRTSGQLQRICQRLGREIQRNDPTYGRAVAVICPDIEKRRIDRGRDERVRLGDERGYVRGMDGPAR